MNVHLTRKEVSSLLGISERTVTRKVKEGIFKTIRKGNKVLFPKDQFEIKDTNTRNTIDVVLEALQLQLQEKDKQIERLQAQLKEQSDLVRNEQVISKGLQDKLFLIPERTGVTEQVSTTKPKEKKKVKKRGFFKRLFKIS